MFSYTSADQKYYGVSRGPGKAGMYADIIINEGVNIEGWKTYREEFVTSAFVECTDDPSVLKGEFFTSKDDALRVYLEAIRDLIYLFEDD